MAAAEHAITPLDIAGAVVTERCGPSRALVIGAPELAAAVAAAGHEVLALGDYRHATVVVVGNDFELTYERSTAAARAVAAGAPPIVFGKPEPPLFRMALARIGVEPREAAMVGDSEAADIAGGRAVGMRTVLYAPDGNDDTVADAVVRSFRELAVLAGIV